MHGNILNKNKIKLFNTANSDLAGRISILENNVYKVTYYEIISGASGTLTVPTGATINSGEFSGANCILSEINGSNKPTFVTPLDGGGTPVTSTLNVGTGAWVKSGVTVSVNVALIYSVDITAADYQNLNNFYIIDNVLISSLSQVLTNSGTASTLSSELSRVISDETGSGSLVFGTSPTFTTDITTPLVIGGTANASYTSYKATTGTGASADPAHVFKGGANGGTEIMRLLNGGKVGIGAIPTGAGYLQVNSNTTDEVASFTSSDAIAYIALTDSTGTGYLGTGSTGRVFIGSVASVSSSNLVIMGSGNGMGYGVTFPSITGLHIQKTTEQLRLGYDASNYLSTTIGSTGNATLTLTGGATPVYNLTNIVNIGNYASPANLRALTIGQDTAYMSFGSLIGTTSYWALYGNQGTPSATNPFIYGTSSDTLLNAGVSAGRIYLQAGGNTLVTLGIDRCIITAVAQASGAQTNFTFTKPNNTGQTASTAINGVLWTLGSRQWATGAITTQKEFELTSPTYSFVGASVITSAYTLFVNKPTASTNATITNNYSFGTDGNLDIQGGTINNSTGAITIQAQTTTVLTLNYNTQTHTLNALSGGARNGYVFNGCTNTNQTASTEINGVNWTGFGRQWATGAITTQREFVINSPTYSFVGASTITDAYTTYITSPIAGTNATITRGWALGLSGGLEVTSGTGRFAVVGFSGTQTAVYMNNTTAAGATNYAILTTNSTAIFNGRTNMSLAVGGTSYLALNTSADNVMFSLSNAVKTGNTASTENPYFKIVGASQTWSAGTITTQRWNYLTANTAAFDSASTITNSYGLYVEAATAGTNATITNNYAAGFSGNVEVAGNIDVTGGNRLISSTGGGLRLGAASGNTVRLDVSGTASLTVSSTQITLRDPMDFVLGATTGTKFGTATTQKLSFWNATPIVQPTTAVAAATFVANTSGIVNDTATFDGYTIGQIVKALRNTGLLA